VADSVLVMHDENGPTGVFVGSPMFALSELMKVVVQSDQASSESTEVLRGIIGVVPENDPRNVGNPGPSSRHSFRYW
jgi:hypothetical protein